MKFSKFSRKHLDFILRHPSQDSKINVLSGSVRSGKTTDLNIKMLALCEYKVDGLKLLIGQSKESVRRNILESLFELVGPKNYTYNMSTGQLRLFKSTWYVLGCSDVGQIRAIQGSTVGVAILDEGSLCPEAFFQVLVTRLSPPGSRLYVSTNPAGKSHYLYRDYIANKELIRAGRIWSETFRLEDNWSLDPEYVALQKSLFVGVFYRRMILGEWCDATGSIYAGVWTDAVFFDDETVPVGLDSRWNAHYTFIDYGTTNQFVALACIDDGTRLWVTKEYVHDSRKVGYQLTDAQYADKVIEFQHPDSQVILDPSAASFAVELRQRGISVRDADNEVSDGIRVTSTALSRGLARVHRSCTNLSEQMAGYAWDEKAANGKEAPVKEDDHGPDAFRYGCKTLLTGYRLAA
jgi:PBSX family phage terminase large subunit